MTNIDPVQAFAESLGYHFAKSDVDKETYLSNDVTDHSRPTFVNAKDMAFFYKQSLLARKEELQKLHRLSGYDFPRDYDNEDDEVIDTRLAELDAALEGK